MYVYNNVLFTNFLCNIHQQSVIIKNIFMELINKLYAIGNHYKFASIEINFINSS